MCSASCRETSSWRTTWRSVPRRARHLSSPAANVVLKQFLPRGPPATWTLAALFPVPSFSHIAEDGADGGAGGLEAGIVRAQGVDHVLERVGVVGNRDVVAGVLRALALQGDVVHVGGRGQKGVGVRGDHLVVGGLDDDVLHAGGGGRLVETGQEGRALKLLHAGGAGGGQ